MIVFRLSKTKYNKDLSGKGAEISGGRWNSKGMPMIYTSLSRALCTVEIAVHTPLGNLPKEYNLITIEIPDHCQMTELKASKLPANWKSFPHPNSTQTVGDKFLMNSKYLGMKVPSVVVQGDYNLLINPNHRDIHNIKIVNIEPFTFDERLFNR